MYQKCPICEGEGRKQNPLITSGYDTCKTCRGAGIIDEVTGLPPWDGVVVNTETVNVVPSAPFENIVFGPLPNAWTDNNQQELDRCQDNLKKVST